ARGQDHGGALGGEGLRDGAADAAAGAGDQRNLAGQRLAHSCSPRPALISSMNSARVSGRSRKPPDMAEVTALEFCFSTPRLAMDVFPQLLQAVLHRACDRIAIRHQASPRYSNRFFAVSSTAIRRKRPDGSAGFKACEKARASPSPVVITPASGGACSSW